MAWSRFEKDGRNCGRTKQERMDPGRAVATRSFPTAVSTASGSKGVSQPGAGVARGTPASGGIGAWGWGEGQRAVCECDHASRSPVSLESWGDGT